MSASLFNNNIMKSIFFKSENISIDEMIFRMGLIFIPDMVYTYGTNNTKIINLKKKYQFTTNGYTKFMLVDTNDTHYCVNNTFWYWKWDATEDWNKIEKNNSIKINYYGYRIPFLGIFPNIYKFSN